MEAELVRELPEGEGWQYEPKWDGFRGVLENVDGELALWSRNERPLLRYFPELRPLGESAAAAVRARRRGRDRQGRRRRLRRDADAPAPGRVADPRLSAEIPAEYVVFDVLLWDGEPVWKRPLEERRAGARGAGRRASGCRRARSRSTRREAGSTASRRSASTGSSPSVSASPYLPGSRDGMVKVKEHKSADCVVVGVRWKGDREAIATLLLGLYREDGGLDYVGSCAVAAKTRADVAAKVVPLVDESRERAVLGAEPVGNGRARGGAAPARARGRGALRQGAGEPLPPRDEAAALAGRQGPARLHVAGAAPAASAGGASGRVALLAVGVADASAPGSRRPCSAGPRAGTSRRSRPGP